MKLRNFT